MDMRKRLLAILGGRGSCRAARGDGSVVSQSGSAGASPSQTNAKPFPSAGNGNGRPPRCHIPWQQMVVDSDGTVNPCCYWSAYGNLNPACGNLNDTPLWRSGTARSIRTCGGTWPGATWPRPDARNCLALRQGNVMGLQFDPAADREDPPASPYAKNLQLLRARSPGARRSLKPGRRSSRSPSPTPAISAASTATRTPRAACGSGGSRPSTRSWTSCPSWTRSSPAGASRSWIAAGGGSSRPPTSRPTRTSSSPQRPTPRW